jgi:serine protease inhibitor
MNRSQNFILLTALALCSGCQSATDSTLSVNPGISTLGADLRVSASFARQTTDFAFDAFRRINTAEGNKNVFVSPLSLHIALGMLLNGADGQTAADIQKTLKLDAQTLTEANATYKNLLAGLPALDPKVSLNIANSVWYRNGFAIEPAYLTVLRDTFSATSTGLNFADPSAKNQINQWASEQTNGKIKTVIQDIKPEHVLFLLNALYFKGDWKTRFDAAKTADAPFTLADGRKTSVLMMRLDSPMRRTFRPSYSAFELPYAMGKYVMTVLLPAENSTANALINTMTPADWNQLQQDMTEAKTDFGMPRFSFSYEIGLNNVLTQMGMGSAFSDGANLTKISRTNPLKVDFVKQNTFVAVDETGTEAAAVTSIGVSVTSVQLPVLCNRPFVVVIHEKTTGAILFMGKIADPTAGF